ncbi:Uncharacterised protein [Streptococcus constellatus]|uniref:Uncharacterized protein n=1 Tax=Streptococcus constellatus TaxID=76860 RepID=A0A564TVD4_STRCV|nr:hypothetical protein [Streptococcus constellatus]VUX11180.1 Uncharacterised protein [Streptococcus constellatus]VUX12748.1 Uncharacterised protein [Streptococcus gordonii]
MKRDIPFLAVLLFFYLLFYGIVHVIPMDELLRKGLVVNNVLIYSPLVTFLVGAVYAGLYGFSRRFVLLATLMFLVTILSFGEWILLYHAAYFICLLVGTLLGYGVFRWRKTSK